MFTLSVTLFTCSLTLFIICKFPELLSGFLIIFLSWLDTCGHNATELCQGFHNRAYTELKEYLHNDIGLPEIPPFPTFLDTKELNGDENHLQKRKH